MKVIIYFGHHKVGSTALQAFLAQNQLALLREGILYPGVESEAMSYALAGALDLLEPPKDDAPVSMNIREPHNALAFQMLAQANKTTAPKWHPGLPSVPQMFRAIRVQARYANPHTVVLCSEVMANFGPSNPDLIDRLRNIFPDAEYEFYCVVRRPDEYLISWHAQRLRFGDKVDPLSGDGALNYGNSIHFNFRNFIAPWVEKFPEDRFHVRNYADVLKAGGSVEDFMAQVGLAIPHKATPPGRANASLPRAGMEIARRGNHDLPPPAAHKMVQYLLRHAAELQPKPNKDIEMFGADVRARIIERFTPVHDYLSGLTDQKAFFPDIDQVSQERPIPEAVAVADLLSKINVKQLEHEALPPFIDGLRRDYKA